MDLGQLWSVGAAVDQQCERAARIDGRELVGVADQEDLRACSRCEIGEPVKGRRPRQRRLVDDDELTGT